MPLTSSYFVSCPYCLEQFEVIIDLSTGSQVYVEDCEVCCHPIRLRVQIEDGRVVDVEAERENN